jgi:two-component system, NarL family, response regulator LiaR
MTAAIRLLLVDDYPVVLSGLVAMFQNHAEIEVVGVATEGKKAVALALALRPQVVLMNMQMPEMDGIEATRQIKAQAREINILMFSGISSNDKVIASLNAGAIGYILKDASETELLQAILQVAAGKAWLHQDVVGQVLKQMQGTEEKAGLIDTLTERELEVLRCMAQGYSNREIAKKMAISITTVHSHVSHILAKLEVSSRTAAVIYAMREGVVTDFGDEAAP